MAAPYDNRRFRTTKDLVIPAGTLVVPVDGGILGELNDGTERPLVARFPIDEALRIGVIKQLGEGEA